MELYPAPIEVIDDDTMATATATNVPSAESVVAYVGAATGASDHRVIKSADESVTSSTAMQDDDELYFPVAAGEVWTAEVDLVYEGITSADIAVGWSLPAGATAVGSAFGLDIAATSSTASARFVAGAVTSGISFLSLGGVGAGVQAVGRYRITVTNGGTAGNVRLIWAQRVSQGTATIVKAGSTLIAERIPF